MKLLLDQGLPYSSVQHLRAAGWEVVHTVDLSMQRASDEEIIVYARDHGYTCATLDADFHSIIAVANETSPSVIRIRQQGLRGNTVADLLLEVYPSIAEDLERGAFVTITDKAVRVRLLPVQSQ